MSSPPVHKDGKVIVVGAGVFGLTLALELNGRGYTNIVILDRYLPPVPDGSSVDISRVIRPDYADQFYADMALEAMKGWKSEFAPFFHRSGLLSMAETKNHPYIQQARKNLERSGMSLSVSSGNEAKRQYTMIKGNISHMEGYANTDCGWADAFQSMRCLAERANQAGIAFISGNHGTVTSLITNGRRIAGVRTKAGTSIHGDLVVVATGAWTPLLLNMEQSSVSTGQPVGFLQLTEQEVKDMHGCPIIINLTTGWFCFPPTPGDHIFKVVRHGYGFETRTETAVSGKQILTSIPSADKNNAASQFIPGDAEKALRDGLRLFFPALQDRGFKRRRLCWYTDTPKGDFIVDYHPEYENLFMACGGSGHAFKFLPVLGRHTADNFERKASKQQREKWAWKPTTVPISKGDGSRGGPPRRVLSREEQAKL